MNFQNLIEFFPSAQTIHMTFCNEFEIASHNLETFSTYYVENLSFKDGCPIIRAYTIYGTWCSTEQRTVYHIFGWTISKNRIEIDDEPLNANRFTAFEFALSFLMNKREVYEIKK
ncbi:hypothetical protein Lazarus_038 [Acinetobacter phage vB_AbaM_Lazarus]|uniref:Uncharacterized protein n=1 Tax=Acinetobacter phage vB_AbaM_Lazarus TaxID=2686289 RepID=A0A6B9SVT5_9CAUD|nr:hypothetical protein HYQ23_gp038 [Acinetobacter phage vB_AbaM_Lazarus]QHJ73974.1 hypothetical protein Lazarus_038 [Acinetobacter phage vB_AbaM_Lazarus]